MFFVCSLIECIGRQQKLRRGDVVEAIGREMLERIYAFSDVLHCEPIAKVADDYVRLCNIPAGSFDNVATCEYDVPDCWTIGDVYERLIRDVETGHPVETLVEVYRSWISDKISCYNTDFFYQSREYIKGCWDAGTVIRDD